MGNSKSLYSKQEYLYYYIEKNDLISIRKQLEATPELINDPLNKDSKQNALMRAAYNGNYELVKMLISMKADVNYATPKGETALTTAVKRNHIRVVELLISENANVAHVSQIGLRVIEYAILAGFYEIARMIYRKLDRRDQEDIQDPPSYERLAKKYIYRYVNYQMFIEALIMDKEPEELGNYLKREKVKLVDPVVDPRETWKQWIKRTIEWKDAPLVERSELPDELQPQNRVLGKLHHYTNNFMSTPLSQKTSLKPREKLDTREVQYLCFDVGRKWAICTRKSKFKAQTKS